ncbi:hypothetical protein ACQQ2N_03165 [Dokdonella sp. MW10]|uniref:hypothetical protein n=1 Tax=Dokdonella sp. MW10 TaxID=2992926 RepID=UPI003F81C95B
MNAMRLAFCTLLVVAVAGCDLQEEGDARMGDQNFKTAIALIELHKVRTGSYPATLDDLRFAGAWDQISLASVEYVRLESGYELNLTRGWIGTPSLTYPNAFWQGLGIRKSNMQGVPGRAELPSGGRTVAASTCRPCPPSAAVGGDS